MRIVNRVMCVVAGEVGFVVAGVVCFVPCQGGVVVGEVSIVVREMGVPVSGMGVVASEMGFVACEKSIVAGDVGFMAGEARISAIWWEAGCPARESCIARWAAVRDSAWRG